MSVRVLQVLQQELEKLSKERPSLTPRPTRELTPLKDLINNDKASAGYGLQLCKVSPSWFSSVFDTVRSSDLYVYGLLCVMCSLPFLLCLCHNMNAGSYRCS